MRLAMQVAVVFLLVASPSLLMASEPRSEVIRLPGGQMIASGSSVKAEAGTTEIPFGVTFDEPPIVTVTPMWRQQVGYVETIVKVTSDRFQINSQNAAPDYVVNWMAVGRR